MNMIRPRVSRATRHFFLAAWMAGLSAPLALPAALVIEGGTLIDGTGAAPVPDTAIVIEGDRITLVGKRGAVAYPAGARVINASGKFIIPGFVDSHAHYHDWAGELFLVYGVTTVMDLGNATEWILAFRDGIQKKKIRGPRLYSSGAQLDGISTSPLSFQRPQQVVVSTVEEARKAVHQLIERRVDAIKVYANLTPEQLKAMAEEARSAGLPVIGHSFNAKVAVENGLEGVEHTDAVALATLPPEKFEKFKTANSFEVHAQMELSNLDSVLQALHARGAYLNPTLRMGWQVMSVLRNKNFESEDFDLLFKTEGLSYVPTEYKFAILKEYRDVGDGYRLEDLDEAGLSKLNRGYENLLEIIRRYARMGGKIYAGTDTANISTPGLSMHQELQMLVEDAGLSPMEALLTATKYSAEVIKKDRLIGTLEPQKKADLIVLPRNPLENIRNTREIEAVILDGEVVDRRFNPRYDPVIRRNYPEDTSHIYPSPVIKRIQPEVAVEEGPDVRVKIQGFGFIPYSVARFINQPLETFYKGPFELEAVIPSRLLAVVGTFPLAVLNPRPTGTVFARGGSEITYLGTRTEVSNEAFFIVKFK